MIESSALAPTDIAISFPTRGSIRLESRSLFAEPGNDACRLFLERISKPRKFRTSRSTRRETFARSLTPTFISRPRPTHFPTSSTEFPRISIPAANRRTADVPTS